MRLQRILLALALLLVCLPQLATAGDLDRVALRCPDKVVISDDLGGWQTNYDFRHGKYLLCRTKVRLVGVCASACAGVLTLDSGLVCVGPKAVVRVHAVVDIEPLQTYRTGSVNRFSSDTHFNVFPSWAKAYLGPTAGREKVLTDIPYKELLKHYRPCP